jgi:RNAse (barnase) inhibitor barstar
MFSDIYKKIVIDFSKVTSSFFNYFNQVFSLFQAKNFNLDASSDALIA